MRHHYIPQWLLRNFLDSSGKIYGFVKSNPSGGVFATTPKKLMVKKDLYALLGESGPARQAVEGRFSKKERREKEVADKIITAARNNAPPRLTPEERSICHCLHYGMWARTLDNMAENDEHKEPWDIGGFLERYAKELNLNVHDMEVARKSLHDEDYQKVTDHDANVRAAAARPTPVVIEALEGCGIRIARISKPNKSFVIGSYALAPARYRGEGHVWLPISHDVAVEPSPGGTETLVKLTRDHDIRAINEASFRQSSIVAARSEQLLRSLAKMGSG